MARDRHKTLQSAERLLKQGKVQAALTELEQLSKGAPGDLLTLNRMGDLLVRQGRTEEATGYYVKIAAQFTKQGFYPKAAAIQKKILRLDADNTEAMLQLADLYIKQKLPGEARTYYLGAAERLLQEKEFTQAREIYERLAEAEPEDPRHRARIAETLAAEGKLERAGEALLGLADSLIAAGKPEDAEQAYRRAGELLAGRPEPSLGIARTLSERGQDEDALSLLEQAADSPETHGEILGELLLRYEKAQRLDDSMRILRHERAVGIGDASLREVFELHMQQGQAEATWKRFDPVFQGWSEQGHDERLLSLLAMLCDVERDGHLPAIQRLHDLHESMEDRAGTIQTLERLVTAYRQRSMESEAASALERLREVAPMSPLLKAGAVDEPEAARPARTEAAAETPAPGAEGTLELAEAPAVPLSRGDEEFVTGRLTQSEILEKYGLKEKALEQVLEVTSKFPGHVDAQQKRVNLLRGEADRAKLGEGLVQLALALRASGDAESARQMSNEASQTGSLSPETLGLLERMGLVGSAPAAGEGPAPLSELSDEAVLIDFDGLEVEAPADAAPAVAEPVAPAKEPDVVAAKVRAPGKDMLTEIRDQLRQGMGHEAQRRVEALRTLGYSSPELDEVAQQASDALAGERAAQPEPAAAANAGPISLDLDDDDDLSAITAALESELFAETAEPPAPDAESEQSLEEVFAAFKQHVDEEVAGDDFRTHYDLGIAYKEMGLIPEAIGEFQIALKADEKFRDACSMLAVCHRDLDDLDGAANWYRQAIEAPGSDLAASSGLRYDLAEVLLQAGDREGALSVFRDVMEADPSYRDTKDRIAELEAPPAG